MKILEKKSGQCTFTVKHYNSFLSLQYELSFIHSFNILFFYKLIKRKNDPSNECHFPNLLIISNIISIISNIISNLLIISNFT